MPVGKIEVALGFQGNYNLQSGKADECLLLRLLRLFIYLFIYV